MSGSGFYFDPTATGLSVFLGPTEARLMELAFTRGRLTVKSALLHLDSDDTPAYTTVMTVLSRLAEKGLLIRRKEGRTFEYSPRLKRREFIAERIQIIQSCLEKNFERL